MWEHMQRTGSDPLEKLNSGLFAPAPKTTHYRGAASRRSRDPKVRENHGSTYAGERKSAGWAGGNYAMSQREQKLAKMAEKDRLYRSDRQRERQDEQIRLALEWYAEQMAEYDEKNGY